jgi:hypothetical protein
MGNQNPATALSDPQILSSLKFTIGRRPTGADANAPFNPMPMAGTSPNNGNAGAAGAAGQEVQLINGRLIFDGATQLDGEYVILVPMSGVKAAAAKAGAGLIKENSAPADGRARAGSALVVLAAAVWFLL